MRSTAAAVSSFSGSRAIICSQYSTVETGFVVVNADVVVLIEHHPKLVGQSGPQLRGNNDAAFFIERVKMRSGHNRNSDDGTLVTDSFSASATLGIVHSPAFALASPDLFRKRCASNPSFHVLSRPLYRETVSMCDWYNFFLAPYI
jgi:hypothetical protein